MLTNYDKTIEIFIDGKSLGSAPIADGQIQLEDGSIKDIEPDLARVIMMCVRAGDESLPLEEKETGRSVSVTWKITGSDGDETASAELKVIELFANGKSWGFLPIVHGKIEPKKGGRSEEIRLINAIQKAINDGKESLRLSKGGKSQEITWKITNA